MYNKEKTWELLSNILTRIIENKQVTIPDSSFKNYFDSAKPPTISLYNYLERIHKYAECSDSSYVLAFIYIDRLLQNCLCFALSNINIHRLVITAIVLAVKYLDDKYSSNKIYAIIGGITLEELNYLESYMISKINYKLYVNPIMYYQYENELILKSMKYYEDKLQRQEDMEDCYGESLKPVKIIERISSIEALTNSE